jgi:RNA polymerase-binding protein DksA
VEFEALRRSLQSRLDTLRTRVSKIESDLRSPGSQDSEERATEQENEEVLERLSASERSEIEAIRRAIARIDEGRYGLCSACGDAIDPKRLEVLPFTDRCVSCAR